MPIEAPSEFELDLFVPPHPYAATGFVATTAYPATMAELVGMAPGAATAALTAYAATLTPVAAGMAAGAATATTAAYTATLTAQAAGFSPSSTVAALTSYGVVFGPVPAGMGPGAATIALSAFSASLAATPATLTAGTAAATIAAYAATAGATGVFTPGAAAAAATAYSATLVPAAVTLTAGAAATTLTAYAATLAPQAAGMTAGTAAVTLTAYAGSVVAGAVGMTAGTTTATLTAFIATVVPGAVGMTAGATTATLAAYGATVVPGAALFSPAAATITLTAYAATLTATSGADQFTPGTVAAALTAYAATFAAQAALMTPAAATATLTSYGATLAATPLEATPGAATITATAYSATLAATELLASPGTTTATLTAYSATLGAVAAAFAPAAATVTLTAYSATLTATPLQAIPGTTTATLTAYGATLAAVAALMSPAAAAITTTAYSATLAAAGGFLPGAAAATLTAYAPTLNPQPAQFGSGHSSLAKMIAFWRLEEATGAGDRVDAHSTYDLTASGSITAQTVKHGNGVVIDDSDTLTNSAAGLNAGTGDFTALGWIRYGSVNQGIDLWTAGGDATRGAGWKIESTGLPGIRLRVSDGSTARTTAIITVSNGVLYMWVVRLDRSGNAFFEVYDSTGSLVSSDTIDISDWSAVNMNSQTQVAGNAGEAPEYDSTCYFNEYLTNQEVSDILNGGAGWDYDDFGSALPAATITLTAYGATMTATPTFNPGAAAATLTAYGATMTAGLPMLYYLKDTNVETTCDAGTSDDFDLSKTQGSATTNVISANSASFVEAATYDMDVSGDSPSTGSHTVEVSINALDADTEIRWRLQAIDDAGCGVSNSSAYSAVYSTTGAKSDNLTLTWTGSDERLRISFEIRRSAGHGARSVTLDVNHANSKITPPW